jgi:hypothetical protein
MGMLFRAVVGFSIAFYAHDSQSALVWLDQTIIAPIEARCAEGLDLCGDRVRERTAAMLAGASAGGSAR